MGVEILGVDCMDCLRPCLSDFRARQLALTTRTYRCCFYPRRNCGLTCGYYLCQRAPSHLLCESCKRVDNRLNNGCKSLCKPVMCCVVWPLVWMMLFFSWAAVPFVLALDAVICAAWVLSCRCCGREGYSPAGPCCITSRLQPPDDDAEPGPWEDCSCDCDTDYDAQKYGGYNAADAAKQRDAARKAQGPMAAPPAHAMPELQASSSEQIAVRVDSVGGARSTDVYARALHDHTSTAAGELSFRAGERLLILTQPDDGWWRAENESKRVGKVPANFMQIVRE